MPRGGARTGAGRRPAKKHVSAVEAAEIKIKGRLPEIVDRMIELATFAPPDRQACEYLMNRIMGKPTERREVSGPDGGPLELVEVALARAYATLDSDDDSDPEP